MSGYESDYTDDIYERYMCTGEGAELFEDYKEYDDVEELEPTDDGGECFGELLNYVLDERIKEMEQQLAALKRAQNKNTAKK